jgi:hypothetical protein
MIFAAFAAAVLAAGCSKEPDSGETAPAGTTFTATMTPLLTKASINHSKVTVLWNPGDRICVNGAVSAELTETAETAVFTFEDNLKAPYKAVFPASIYKDASNVTLPAELGVDGLNLALAGYTEKGSNLRFSALTALLEVSVKAGETPATLKEIVLRGLNKEQISGPFGINYVSHALTGKSTAAEDREVKILVNRELSAEPIVVYIPVPAGEYSLGYQVDFINSEDKIMRQTVSARTLKAGELRVMPELPFAVNYNPEPITALGGIPDAAELKAFAAAVNAEESIARWLNDAGEVELLADIDLGGEEWTPIGNGSVTTSATEPLAASAVAFTGVFDGKGHTIDNFKVTVDASGANVAGGLFGVVKGATLKNLTIGDKTVLKTSSTSGFVSLGAIVGFASESTLSNLDSHAKLINDGGKDNVRLVLGGTVGSMFSNTTSCTATDLKGHASFDVVNNVNTKNGGTGFIVGGVVGWTDGVNYESAPTLVKGCVNYSNFSAQATRTGGVIGTMNTGTHAEDCVNYGNISCTDVKASNSRPSGIVSAMGNKTTIKGCVNYGDICFPVTGDTTHGYAAGVVGQTNDGNDYFTVIDGCATYGTIQSDRWFNTTEKFMGIICASFNAKKVTVKNCILGGKIGPYTPTEEDPVITIDATNFQDYYSLTAANRIANVVFENNSFGTRP